MPELPEIETLTRQLREKVCGHVLSKIEMIHSEILESPRSLLEEKISRKRVEHVERRGKYLGLKLDSGYSLWFHLGMTGQLLWKTADSKSDPHVHARIRLDEIGEVLIFRDIRKFGCIFAANGNPALLPARLKRLGPEPAAVTAETFANVFKLRTGRIKNLLLNQHVIAGLGNIYADESLHRAGIHPKRRPYRLNRAVLIRLHGAILETFEEAIRSGGSSIDDYRHTDGARGKFQEKHRVYGREGKKCFSCGTLIRRIKLSGRSSYFCPQCQS